MQREASTIGNATPDTGAASATQCSKFEMALSRLAINTILAGYHKGGMYGNGRADN
jgi:hypothetical protein